MAFVPFTVRVTVPEWAVAFGSSVVKSNRHWSCTPVGKYELVSPGPYGRRKAVPNDGRRRRGGPPDPPPPPPPQEISASRLAATSARTDKLGR